MLEQGGLEPERRRFDVKRYIPTALRAQDKSVSLFPTDDSLVYGENPFAIFQQAPSGLLEPRFYAMKKTAMTIMCLLVSEQESKNASIV